MGTRRDEDARHKHLVAESRRGFRFPQAGKLTRNGQTGHSTPMSCSPIRMPASVGDKSPSHSQTMLLSRVAETNLARADACQAQSSHSGLPKGCCNRLSTVCPKKNSGGNDGLMESLEDRTIELSGLPPFPQPLEIASAAIPTFPPHDYHGV